MVQGLEREVLELLETQGRCSVIGIAEILDRHPTTVDRQCYDLQVDGYIAIASSGGTYKLTEEGRNRLTDMESTGQ